MTKNNTPVEPVAFEPVSTTFSAMVDAYVPAERPADPSDVHAIVWSETMNTSQKIKALGKMGYKNATIQKVLNPWYEQKNGRALRYQHVRNVLTQNYKKVD
jgi:hypothetical protein